MFRRMTLVVLLVGLVGFAYRTSATADDNAVRRPSNSCRACGTCSPEPRGSRRACGSGLRRFGDYSAKGKLVKIDGKTLTIAKDGAGSCIPKSPATTRRNTIAMPTTRG